MKNTVLVIVSTVLGGLTLMIVMSIYGRMNRSMELQSNLPSVIEETVENIMVSQKYNIHSRNEFLADLVSSLSLAVDADSDITVDVLQCDKDKGILGINVTAAYLYPNGKTGTVACERTVILNKLEIEEPVQCKVILYVGSDIYKEYCIPEGSVIGSPADPTEINGVFYGWVDDNGNTVDFNRPVNQNTIFYADIR